MTRLVLFVVACTFGMAFAPAPIPHAGCNVIWSVTEACASAQQKIVNQMDLWADSDCSGNTTMKCMYNHTGSYGQVTLGTHTTWDFGYIDDIDFVFTDTLGGCSINGRSRSQVFSIGDFSVNYCNLFNLMNGSALITDPGFEETSFDEVCTQYSDPQCDYY